MRCSMGQLLLDAYASRYSFQCESAVLFEMFSCLNTQDNKNERLTFSVVLFRLK